MTTKDSNPTPLIEQDRPLMDGRSREAYRLWARRIPGRPLYQYTVQRVGWAIACPTCGNLLLLEVIFDSENGTLFKCEACPCGGVQ